MTARTSACLVAAEPIVDTTGGVIIRFLRRINLCHSELAAPSDGFFTPGLVAVVYVIADDCHKPYVAMVFLVFCATMLNIFSEFMASGRAI